MTADPHHNDLEHRRRRALYRSQHRGTKEMDWLLGRYAEAHLAGMDGDALTAFEQFISISDVELQTWFLYPEQVKDRAFDGLVSAVRAFHKLA